MELHALKLISIDKLVLPDPIKISISKIVILIFFHVIWFLWVDGDNIVTVGPKVQKWSKWYLNSSFIDVRII